MSREDFTFDKERNAFACPQGKLLHTTGKINDGEMIVYRGDTYDPPDVVRGLGLLRFLSHVGPGPRM